MVRDFLDEDVRCVGYHNAIFRRGVHVNHVHSDTADTDDDTLVQRFDDLSGDINAPGGQ